jgi:hypothetical protein
MDHALLVRCSRWCAAAALAGAVLLATAPAAVAQVTPAAGYTPPDDTPSVKIGAVLFADFTTQQTPKATDADGNIYNPSSFNVSRGYINVTGNLNHLISFRITPDVTRESGTGSSLNGSMTFRLKYAFMQINLDDWLPKGSWIRVGMQQTPLVDNLEGIYRYRFQGTIFPERAGYMSSADTGVSFRTAFPNNYGDIHVGYYNGEGYSKAETNDQKALEARVGFRPLPRQPILKNWQLKAFYTYDHYVPNAPRTRLVLDTTFEHPYLNIGFDFLDTHDQTSAKPGSQNLNGRGWAVWATPRKPFDNGSSVEALLRYDYVEPNHDIATVDGSTVTGLGQNKIAIAGLSYWFPKTGSVSSAVMIDFESLTYSAYLIPRAPQQRIYVHTMITF